MKRWTSEEIQFTLPVWVKLTGLTAAIILLVSIAGSLFLKQQVIHRTREIREMNGVLIESEKKYRDLVMLANTIILRWSHDGKITFLNEFGLKFFEYSEEEILGQHVTVIFPEEEEAGLKLDRFLNESRDSPQKFERKILQNIRRNGKRVWIDWTNRVIFDDHGQIKEVLSIGSDITARKKAEDEIHRLNADLRKYADNLEMRVKERTAQLASAKEQAESADRLKSAFLATMSHELRTPLNSIIGFTGILLQELAGPLNPEQKKQLGMVQNSSRHLLALINDVLDISKIEAGQMDLSPGPFELGESIDKMVGLVSPLAEKKGLNLKVEIAENVGTVINDQRRLEQVILNLLNNAVKFTDSGYVHVSCLLEHGRYILTVSDTGTGIHQEEIPGLFQPFHQIDTGLSRRHEGTGLGLSICRKLLEMMGGSIEVKSEFGKGSSFTIIFPVETGGLI